MFGAQELCSLKASQLVPENLMRSTLKMCTKKKTPVEHVLLRPGMYIGSVEETEQAMWVLSSKETEEGKGIFFQNETLKYNPGLYKLFDEILVNAIDNHARDKTTTRIDVELPDASSTSPSFLVRNNGRGIPVQYHSAENVHVPEMVLGQLLTGSNFADAKVRHFAQCPSMFVHDTTNACKCGCIHCCALRIVGHSSTGWGRSTVHRWPTRLRCEID